jgi:nitrogen fixation protein NifZ
MFDLREPKYQWGQRVKALADLINDGTFPEAPASALLVPAGGAGEIVQIGRHTEANLPVYLVEFGERLVVGCFEDEIALL